MGGSPKQICEKGFPPKPPDRCGYPRAPAHVSRRAVLVGLVLLPLNAWWQMQIEYVRYSDNATTSALFFHCVAILLLLVGFNAVLQRLAPKWAFSRAEILTIYMMLVVASALQGHDQLQILSMGIAWPYHRATPENRWQELFHRFLPPHLVPSDPALLEPLFRGGASLYEAGRWRGWLGPVGWWGLFALAVVWTMLCAMALFRRQWDYERLNYPIVEVPLEVTAPGGPLLRNRLFWSAFAAGAIVQFIRLAHNLWPAFPTLNIGVYYYNFREFPLNYANPIPLSSYFFSYGLAYLLPLQLAFSVWFFMWFARVQMVAAAILGYTQWGRFPFVQQQGVGAYFGLALFVVWAARRHLARCWATALARKQRQGTASGDGDAENDLAREPLPPAVAVWGFVGGVAALIAFSTAAGMALPTAACFFALFFPIVLAVTRIRAELGLPTIELYQVGADDIMQNLAGGRAFSGRDLTVMTLYFWLVRTHRQLPMPVQADCLRIGQRVGLPLRDVAWVLLAAAAVAIVAAFWASLHVTYQVGFDSAKFAPIIKWAFGDDPWHKLASWLANPRQPDYGKAAAYLFGTGFTLLLAAMRTRYVWWPFHPVGYLVSGSFGLFRLWLPIFVTWAIKSLLLRYGGLSAYKKARPFFFGLICGEYSAAFVRTLIDLAFNLHLPPESGVGGL